MGVRGAAPNVLGGAARSGYSGVTPGGKGSIHRRYPIRLSLWLGRPTVEEPPANPAEALGPSRENNGWGQRDTHERGAKEFALRVLPLWCLPSVSSRLTFCCSCASPTAAASSASSASLCVRAVATATSTCALVSEYCLTEARSRSTSAEVQAPGGKGWCRRGWGWVRGGS